MKYKMLKNEIEDLKKEIRLLKIENIIKEINQNYNIKLTKNDPVFGFEVTYSDRKNWINVFVDNTTKIKNIEKEVIVQLFKNQNKK